MVTRDETTLARLQDLVGKLIEHRVASSLIQVETAMARWRQGSLTAIGAHGAILKHAAFCERVVERITAAATDRPEAIFRDAVDAGLLSPEQFAVLVGAPIETIAPTGLPVDESIVDQGAKRKVVEELMAQGPVLLHIDPRRPGVAVPERFMVDAALRLRFGYGLSPAIADLEITETHVAGTLSFGGMPFHCVLPWPAIYAAQLDGDAKGMVWPEDVPDDVFAAAADELAAESPTVAPTAKAVNPSPTEPTAGKPETPKKKGGHLRLVD